jgi:hypothetical protein
MQRFLSRVCRGASLAALSVCALSRAEDPAPAPDAAVVPMAQNSPYTLYSDAYLNPDSCRPRDFNPVNPTKGMFLFQGPRHNRYYAGVDNLFWGRTKAANRVLTSTSPNLFDGFGRQITPDGLLRFQTVFDPNSPTRLRSGSPNDPLTRLNVTEFLIPDEVRMQTNDFDQPMRWGFRTTIGKEFRGGDRLEVSYFQLLDFRSKTLVDDVQNASFFVRVPFSGAAGAGEFRFQRFGYLNSNFRTINQAFAGESRRLNVGPDPHNPNNENPPLIPPPANGTFTSNNIPGETTREDAQATNQGGGGGQNNNQITPARQRRNDNGIPFDLLWEDGELAIADYHYNIQGGEILYTKNIFEYERYRWELRMLFAVRYVGMDEGLDFFFADTTFDRAAANPATAVGGQLPVPLQAVGLPSQPANETWATVSNELNNSLLGPTIGISARYPLWSGMEWDLMGKAGFLANFIQLRNRLVRGDGLTLYDYTQDEFLTSGIFEGRLGLNYKPVERLTLRGGFEWMYLIGVGTSPGNLNYQLDRRPRPNNNDDVLFYGFYGGAEWVW